MNLLLFRKSSKKLYFLSSLTDELNKLTSVKLMQFFTNELVAQTNDPESHFHYKKD